MSWTPAEPLPSGIDAQGLAVLTARYDAALVPASPQAFGVAIDRLFRRARLWRIPLPQKAHPDDIDPIAEMVADYRADIGHLPADLLDAAITWACREWCNGFRLPMPSELLAQVSGDLARRQRERMKLGVAALKLEQRPRDRSDRADQTRADAAFATMRAEIAAAPPLQVVERRRDDDRDPAPVSDSIRRGRAALTGLTLEQRVERAEKARGASC